MKVIIVDDHQLVIRGFQRIIEAEGFEVISSFTDSSLALERIPLLKPDIVLSDLDMPKINGAELIRQLREQVPEQKIIMLSMHLNQQVIKKIMGLKVNGYLSKNAHPEELIEALKAVHSGRTYFSSDVTQSLLFKSSEIISEKALLTLNLSDRESEVLKHIAQGESTKEIAEVLHISIGTVESHRRAIMTKLEVKNVAGMVRIAVQEGLV